MKRKKIALTVVVFSLVLIILTGTGISLRVKNQVKSLFRLNKELQEKGYYMADFEFRMLGFSYYLDKGQYIKSLNMLTHYNEKLKNREGLIKIPDFSTNQEEIEFFLNLQNPVTGAFIDETAPYCVFYEVSKNIIDHIVSLTDSTTAPLKLKYPIKFLDEINTPEKLIAHLEDISYVGWIAARFPQTTFHFARNILGAARPDNTFEMYNLYTFSPEWKRAMLQWMYNFQDDESGMWGPKNKRTGKLWKYDLNNTASILKNFRDNEGNDLHKEFPLKHQEKLFNCSITQLSEPFPDEDNLDAIHEWNLRQSKGIKMLLRYLWKDASIEDKTSTEKIIERNIEICFQNYYVREEGAFSYYPNSQKATCDGTTNIVYADIGAFSYDKQKKLWGDPQVNANRLSDVMVKLSDTFDIGSIINDSIVNSIRIYDKNPDFKRLTDNVWALYYPRYTQVLDIMELVPNIVRWSETSPFSMGNWTSLAETNKMYSALNIIKPGIYHIELPVKGLIETIEESKELYFIGFDKLQIPRYRIRYILSNQ